MVCSTGFGDIVLQHIGPGQVKMGECADGVVLHNTALVKDFLELSYGIAAPMRHKIRFTPHIDGIQSKSTAPWDSQLVRACYLESTEGFRGIVAAKFNLSINCGQVLELHQRIVGETLAQVIG